MKNVSKKELKELLGFWMAQASSGQSTGRDTAWDWTYAVLTEKEMEAAHKKFKRWLQRMTSK